MVAREENITKAAQLLHVTQPTLSRQLMQLEEELGVQLFHIGKHSVTLTEDGMLLRRQAQEIAALSEKTISELKNKGDFRGDIYWVRRNEKYGDFIRKYQKFSRNLSSGTVSYIQCHSG